MPTDTKADGDDWMEKATQVLVEKVWTSVGKDGIDAKNDFVTSVNWPNSQNWQRENWMSKLPDNMSVVADWTDAWMQTYTVEEQFKI